VRPVRKERGPGRFSFSPLGAEPPDPRVTGSVFAVPFRPCRWAYGLRVCGSDPALSVGLFEFACTPFGALEFAILGRRARSVVIRGPIRATHHHASTAHPRRGETRPDPHHTSPRRQPNLSVVTRDPIHTTHHHTNTAHPRRGETRPGPHHTSPRRQPNLSVVTRDPIHTTHHHASTAHPRRGETRPDPLHTSPREHRPPAAWPTAARFAPHVSTAHPHCGDLRRLFMPRATREHR
jgi:hypothetical protein